MKTALATLRGQKYLKGFSKHYVQTGRLSTDVHTTENTTALSKYLRTSDYGCARTKPHKRVCFCPLYIYQDKVPAQYCATVRRLYAIRYFRGKQGRCRFYALEGCDPTTGALEAPRPEPTTGKPLLHSKNNWLCNSDSSNGNARNCDNRQRRVRRRRQRQLDSLALTA